MHLEPLVPPFLAPPARSPLHRLKALKRAEKRRPDSFPQPANLFASSPSGLPGAVVRFLSPFFFISESRSRFFCSVARWFFSAQHTAFFLFPSREPLFSLQNALAWFGRPPEISLEGPGFFKPVFPLSCPPLLGLRPFLVRAPSLFCLCVHHRPSSFPFTKHEIVPSSVKHWPAPFSSPFPPTKDLRSISISSQAAVVSAY